jgi:rubredoxin-NAD+ reductase
MRKFRCRYCSHVYDESLGDAGTGIAPGTRFEDIPEDWICPECGAMKADYDLVEEISV